jgi:hypothetical protein
MAIVLFKAIQVCYKKCAAIADLQYVMLKELTKNILFKILAVAICKETFHILYSPYPKPG